MKNFGKHNWKILLAGLVILTIAQVTNYDPKAFLDHYAPDNSKFGLPQNQTLETPYDLSVAQVDLHISDDADDHSATNAFNSVSLSDDRAEHILYGDARGGGHKYGVGVPCKSEFPESWNDEKIIQTTKRLAVNDNADWRIEDNGYHVSEQMVEGVNVRVVLDREGDDIVTAYPINVPRNSCPANDN